MGGWVDGWIEARPVSCSNAFATQLPAGRLAPPALLISICYAVRDPPAACSALANKIQPPDCTGPTPIESCSGCIIEILKIFRLFAVPRAESDGDAALQRARGRGARLRAGAQVTRPGADSFPGQEALQRGDTAGPGADGVAVPEGPAGRRRLSHQSHEVTLT